MNRREFQLGIAGLLAGGWASLARGDESLEWSLPNLPTGTNGGQQFWADVRYHAGWRIQEQALTGHFRLLNPEYERVAWGSLAACEAKLAEIRLENPSLKNSKTAVVCLHGLFRTRWCMGGISEHVAEQTGWQPIVLGYPSTRGKVGDHADKLNQVIDNLDGVEKIYFVAHSLGNLVIRHWMKDLDKSKTLENRKIELGRVVMIGPPNHRPSLAQTLVPIDYNQVIAGEAGQQLCGDWGNLSPCLATPTCEFGILAGGLGDGQGHNPLIPGDDDMIVGVDETRLAGARDFRVLNVIHATMMDDPNVQKLTANFLEHGYFESPEARSSIEPNKEQVSHAETQSPQR
jgi:hypothetical protein